MDAALVGVIGTLAGAIVAGVISIVLAILSNRQALKTSKLTFAEERAKWAAERQLERLQKFYGTAEKLIDATTNLRIQQAWEMSYKKDKIPVPKWVLSVNDARASFVAALQNTNSEMSLLDADIQDEYIDATQRHFNWLIAKTEEQGVQELVEMERELIAFRHNIALRYRKVFDERRHGIDLP